MRVLIFSLAYDPLIGGAEVAVKEITNRIAPAEIEFDMITLRFDKAHAASERIGNVNVYRIDCSKNMYPWKASRFAARLHKERAYDATWAIMANWAGFAASFFKKAHPEVRYALTLQEGDPLEYIERKTRFIRPLWKRIFSRADKAQAISHFLAEWGKRNGAKDMIVIPNGVDVRRFANPAPHALGESVTLITTSRLVAKNGVGDIIEALKYLPAHVRLQVVGTGPLEGNLRALAVEEGVESRVEFSGFAAPEEVPALIHKADIFIRPSLSEGMGNSFIEAMAAGIPVIATPVGGIPDFLADGETGVFCKPSSPPSIVEAVQRLVGDEALRERVKANALAMVRERYDWDLIAKEMKGKVFAI